MNDVSEKTETAVPMNRDAIRAAIFSSESKKPKSKTIPFFGTLIEIRQPTLGQILDIKASDDPKRATIETIVKYSYVPGTDQLVFDNGDIDQIATLPFSEDIQALNNAILELTNINLAEKEAKNV